MQKYCHNIFNKNGETERVGSARRALRPNYSLCLRQL